MGSRHGWNHDWRVLVAGNGLQECADVAGADVDEGNVGRVTAGGVHGEYYQGFFEDFREAVDDVSAEELHLSGGKLCGSFGANLEAGTTAQDDEIFVACSMEMGGNGLVDAEDAGTGGRLVGEANVDEHGFRGLRQLLSQLMQIESAAFAAGCFCSLCHALPRFRPCGLDFQAMNIVS